MLKARKFRSQDVLQVHRKAAEMSIPWSVVIRPHLHEWLTLYEKATNCSINLVMPAALALTSSLCGPKTRIQTSPGVSSTLNLYIVSTSPPGGGKSIVYERIIQEVINDYSERHAGKNFNLETYTTAGMQRHQNENDGYGLISSDEGHRILSSINAKQSKGECERALLCKMWGGAGDHTLLSTGQRGFSSTSMSLACFVQPQPLLNELSMMSEDDGFLDRLLIFATNPMLYKSQVIRDNIIKLQQSKMTDFKKMFMLIDTHHRGQTTTYRLAGEALQRYDEYNDSYVDFIYQKWHGTQGDGDIGDDDETGINQVCSSKDTMHVLRLAANLHVLLNTMDFIRDGHDDEDFNIPLEVDLTTLNAAIALYTAILQQKTIMIEASNNSSMRDEISIQTGNCKSLKERVTSAITNTQSPLTTPRLVQKKLNSVTTEVIECMLGECSREGLGKVVRQPAGSRMKFVFFKPFPNQDTNNILGKYNIDLTSYERNFRNVENMPTTHKDIVMREHQHADLIMDLW